MSTQFSNKNQNALESMPEGVTWLQEGLEMPSNRTKWLLDQLKVEFERGAYRKNIKIETLIRKFKKEGLSERDEQILRLHINLPLESSLLKNQSSVLKNMLRRLVLKK